MYRVHRGSSWWGVKTGRTASRSAVTKLAEGRAWNSFFAEFGVRGGRRGGEGGGRGGGGV